MTVSVIIPAYNCESYIKRCLDSVLLQSGADLDIIVINDGSSDGTAMILEEYKNKARIKTTPNRGSSAARNEGIKMASGDYIMFLDSDDWLAEGSLKRLSDIIFETDADIVKFCYKRVFPDGHEITDSNQFDKFDIIPKKDFKKKIYPLFINGIKLNSACVGIYRADLIKGRAFRENMRVAEDAVFSLETYTKAQKVVILPDVLYNYYQTGTGLTGSGVPVMQKYHCNFIFAAETAKLLKEWNMNSPCTWIKVYLRPLFLTFDKIRRIISSRN